MLNLLLIAAGGVVGFFSIYFRRILSAIMGFIWGAGLGYLMAFLIDMSSGLGPGGYSILILIFAVLTAVLSYKYYRFFVFLNTFLVSLVLFFALVLLATHFNMDASIPIAIILAIIAGIVSAVIYDPLFIISTSLLGGILISLGGVSLFRRTDFIRLIGGIIWSGSGLNQVTVWAIILSIAGIIVQFKLLGKLNSDSPYEKCVTANKQCRQCGKIFSGSHGTCPFCGFAFFEETNQPVISSGDTWVCKKCGDRNSTNSSSCKGCGEYK